MYTTQVEYGHLMACFAQTKELGEYWIIQLYERVLCGDKQLTNEKSALSCSVWKSCLSFQHQQSAQQSPLCMNVASLALSNKGKQSWTMEREHITRSGLLHVHDYSNTLFCLNVYCMKCLKQINRWKIVQDGVINGNSNQKWLRDSLQSKFMVVGCDWICRASWILLFQ